MINVLSFTFSVYGERDQPPPTGAFTRRQLHRTNGNRTNGHVEREASFAGSFTGGACSTAYRGKVKVQVVSVTPIQVVSYPVFSEKLVV